MIGKLSFCYDILNDKDDVVLRECNIHKSSSINYNFSFNNQNIKIVPEIRFNLNSSISLYELDDLSLKDIFLNKIFVTLIVFAIFIVMSLIIIINMFKKRI